MSSMIPQQQQTPSPANNNSNAHHQQQYRGGGGGHGQQQQIPQSLKLTDFLRPVFQEAFMIREYCAFTSIQQQSDLSYSMSSVGVIDEQVLSSSSTTTTLKALTGMYVIPSAQSLHLWFGMLCVNSERSTSGVSPWHGGVFRFVVRFPENYPNGMPSITVLPIGVTTNTPQSGGATAASARCLSSHPDIHATSGQFNLRAYHGSSSSSGSAAGTSVGMRTYKYLRSFRKAFYRQFVVMDNINSSNSHQQQQDSLNQAAASLAASDYPEFLRFCAEDAAESTKALRDVDRVLVQRFNGDRNLILLGSGGGGSGGGEEIGENNGGSGGRRRGSGSAGSHGGGGGGGSGMVNGGGGSGGGGGIKVATMMMADASSVNSCSSSNRFRRTLGLSFL